MSFATRSSAPVSYSSTAQTGEERDEEHSSSFSLAGDEEEEQEEWKAKHSNSNRDMIAVLPPRHRLIRAWSTGLCGRGHNRCMRWLSAKLITVLLPASSELHFQMVDSLFTPPLLLFPSLLYSPGEEAVLLYREEDERVWDLYHTEVPQSQRGKGLGAILAEVLITLCST